MIVIIQSSHDDWCGSSLDAQPATYLAPNAKTCEHFLLLQTELDSFLIQISAEILAFKDTDGTALVDKILDKTGMKGTGIFLLTAHCNIVEKLVHTVDISCLSHEQIGSGLCLQ